PPASVMMMDSTAAKIGRSMKNRENTETSLLIHELKRVGTGRRLAGRRPNDRARPPARRTPQVGERDDPQDDSADAPYPRGGKPGGLAHGVDDVEEHRGQEDAEERYAHHAAEDRHSQ